jgi:uncharacterized membrane protein YdjX (TVP38/TMEM64 family)
MRILRLTWPLLLLVAAIVAAWASGLAQQLNWVALARHQSALTGWVNAHPIGAPALYVVVYTVVVALSLPESAVVTVAGGLLFGTWFGGILSVIGSSLGAIALFLAVRHHLADAVAARGGGLIVRLRATIQQDGFSYLLAIRLIPAFPFWLVNLAAALSGMRLLPYAGATVIGVVPATLVYASIGAGVGKALAEGGAPDVRIIFSPAILGPLIGLAVLSLLPIAWKKWRRSDA